MRVFKSYISGIALLAGILTLSSLTLIKFLAIKFYPQISNDASWRGLFQLSYLCYIPILLVLIIKKVGYNNSTQNVFEKKRFHYFWSFLSVLLLCTLLAVMFTYILVYW